MVFNAHQNPEVVDSVKEQTCQQEWGQTGKERDLPSSMPFKGVVQVKSGSSQVQRSRLKMDFPTSNNIIKKKKDPLQVYPATWF